MLLNQLDRHTPQIQLENSHPKIPCTELLEGEVGYLVASVKDLKSVPVGDTLISAKNPETE